MTKTEKALYDAIPEKGGVRYFGGYGGPHYAILGPDGQYVKGPNPSLNGRRISAQAVRSLHKRGHLRCIERFASDATEGPGRRTGMKLVRTVDLMAPVHD